MANRSPGSCFRMFFVACLVGVASNASLALQSPEGLDALDEREREVVQSHFGLVTAGQTQTLEQIGKRLGVTKERIRQIERRALIKLRGILPDSCLDLVSD